MSWIGPLSIREGRCQLLDSALDGVGQEWCGIGFEIWGVGALADAFGESPNEKDSLGGAEPIEEHVMIDVKGSAEKAPPFPSQISLLVGAFGDGVIAVDVRSKEQIRETVALGRAQMRNRGGSFSGQAKCRKEVSASSER